MLHKGRTVCIHAALLATVCDIPATAKLGGFLGHSSKHACWKCNKRFPYNESLKCVDFSGVDVGSLRTHDQHKSAALRACSAVTPTERTETETETGSRFTELMHIPYYDCVRQAIIDPMHNILLGTPKRLFTKQWVKLLNKTALEEIQDIVRSCCVSSGIGRIPHKISSHFAKLTADEWKIGLFFFLQLLYTIIFHPMTSIAGSSMYQLVIFIVHPY